MQCRCLKVSGLSNNIILKSSSGHHKLNSLVLTTKLLLGLRLEATFKNLVKTQVDTCSVYPSEIISTNCGCYGHNHVISVTLLIDICRSD